MRLSGLVICACVSGATPVMAFDGSGATHALSAQAIQRPGSAVATFAIQDRQVTLNAYGRRARARLNGNVEEMKQARAMGQVFDGAPQPALVTLELSVRF